MTDRWTNLRIEILIPLDVNPDASNDEKWAAADVHVDDAVDKYDGTSFAMGFSLEEEMVTDEA